MTYFSSSTPIGSRACTPVGAPVGTPVGTPVGALIATTPIPSPTTTPVTGSALVTQTATRALELTPPESGFRSSRASAAPPEIKRMRLSATVRNSSSFGSPEHDSRLLEAADAQHIPFAMFSATVTPQRTRQSSRFTPSAARSLLLPPSAVTVSRAESTAQERAKLEKITRFTALYQSGVLGSIQYQANTLTLNPLGSGSHVDVYLVTDTTGENKSLVNTAVVKIFKEEHAQEAESFLRTSYRNYLALQAASEERVARILNNPIADGYFLMQYCQNNVDINNIEHLTQIAWFFAQAQQRILNLDLLPSNFKVLGGRVVMIDFPEKADEVDESFRQAITNWVKEWQKNGVKADTIIAHLKLLYKDFTDKGINVEGEYTPTAVKNLDAPVVDKIPSPVSE